MARPTARPQRRPSVALTPAPPLIARGKTSDRAPGSGPRERRAAARGRRPDAPPLRARRARASAWVEVGAST